MISRCAFKDRRRELKVYRIQMESATQMANDEMFHSGIALFNSGEFFRAHEVWEELWLTEIEPEKTFLQGLVQAAAAFHHYVRGNWAGTESLLASAATKLQRFPDVHRGIAVGKLRADAILWVHSLGEGKEPGREKVPRIEVVR
jgi:predicted metal-dependent hydrolase